MLPSSHTLQTRPPLSTVPATVDSVSSHFSQTVSHDEEPMSDSDSLPMLQASVERLQREQSKIQNLLSSLGFALRSFNNLNQFLELTPLITARVADGDGGALVLFKPNHKIRLEQLYCQDGQLSQVIRHSLDTLARQVSREFLASETEDFATAIASFDQKIQAQLGSRLKIFSTPILVKNRERGRLYIFSQDSQYSWTSTRRKLVQLVSDQTAVAIANNELTLELRKKERQDRELEIASEIQLHLLPNQCPTIEGIELAASFQTANRVGGDYYDFIPIQENRTFTTDQTEQSHLPWSIVIGDVMGKGVPAGLIMTMARGMLRTEILNRHSPGKILEHLNQVMYADLENSNRFLTLFYSEYHPQTRILAYSNAAHNPPLRWKSETKTIEPLDAWGMLIGLESTSTYEEARVKLSLGDCILYYTDGVTDAMSPQGDRFDEDNLYEAFAWACSHYPYPQEIQAYLCQQIADFVGVGNHQGDDITFIVLKVTE